MLLMTTVCVHVYHAENVCLYMFIPYAPQLYRLISRQYECSRP